MDLCLIRNKRGGGGIVVTGTENKNSRGYWRPLLVSALGKIENPNPKLKYE